MTAGAVALIAATLRESPRTFSISDSTDAPRIFGGSCRALPMGVSVSARALGGITTVGVTVASGSDVGADVFKAGGVIRTKVAGGTVVNGVGVRGEHAAMPSITLQIRIA